MDYFLFYSLFVIVILIYSKVITLFYFRDDLRTANIICDDPNGVTCLVIDRETFNQLISSLDEIRTKYIDEGVERKRYILLVLF